MSSILKTIRRQQKRGTRIEKKCDNPDCKKIIKAGVCYIPGKNGKGWYYCSGACITEREIQKHGEGQKSFRRKIPKEDDLPAPAPAPDMTIARRDCQILIEDDALSRFFASPRNDVAMMDYTREFLRH
jgi:hypothetical protein